MKKNTQLLLLFIFFATIISCNKKPESTPEKEYLKVPDEIWSYVNLTPGSWYIYKDSVTGITDSVIVTTSVISYKAPVLNFITGNAIFYTDGYHLVLEKVDLAGNKTIWLDAIADGHIGNFGVGYYWHFSNLMEYPPSGGSSGYPISYKIPAITIEGNNYTDVQVTEGRAWWAKSVGFIKLRNDRNTFTLLRKK